MLVMVGGVVLTPPGGSYLLPPGGGACGEGKRFDVTAKFPND